MYCQRHALRLALTRAITALQPESELRLGLGREVIKLKSSAWNYSHTYFRSLTSERYLKDIKTTETTIKETDEKEADGKNNCGETSSVNKQQICVSNISTALPDNEKHLEPALANNEKHLEPALANNEKHLEPALAVNEKHLEPAHADNEKHLEPALADNEKQLEPALAVLTDERKLQTTALKTVAVVPGKGPPPEPPITCCMSGCANCVWIKYAEELRDYYKDGGDRARLALEKIEDPSLRAFVKLELGL